MYMNLGIGKESKEKDPGSQHMTTPSLYKVTTSIYEQQQNWYLSNIFIYLQYYKVHYNKYIDSYCTCTYIISVVNWNVLC